MKSQAPFKLAWFQIKRCLFLLLPMCRNYLQLLKLLYFIGYKLHKKRHEYTLHTIHVVTAGFDFQFFLRQLSELVHSHTRWLTGNPIIVVLLRDWQILFKILNGCWNIQSLLHKNSTCLCLMQCNFVTSSDFVKSICQSLEQSLLIRTTP